MNPRTKLNAPTPDQLLENLEQKREGFSEILITAIIFGLTINLISDVISITLQDHAVIITLVSILVTMMLLWFMIRRQIGISAKYQRSMKLILMWDSQKGEILSRETGYLPQLIAHTLFSQIESERRTTFSKLLKLKPGTESDDAISNHLAEGVLFTLFERMTVVSDDMESRRVEGSIPTDSLLLRKNDPMRILVLDNESVKYKKRSKGEGVFTIKWFGGLLAKIVIRYNPSKIAYFDDRPDTELAQVDSFYLDEFAGLVAKIAKAIPKTAPEIFPEREMDFEIPQRSGPVIRADFDIMVELGFSSVWYQMRPQRIREIWKWGISFIDALDQTINWETYKAALIGIEWAKDYQKRTRGGPVY